MAVIGGIRVYELVRGHSEGRSRKGGPVAAKAYYVPNWYDRYTVANALLGVTSYVVSGNSITLNAPGAYPESSNIWAQEVSIRGVGTPSQGPKQQAWTAAIVEVSYAPGDYNTSQSQDPGGVNSFDPTAPLIYATQSLDFAAQLVTLPRNSCQIFDGTSYTPLNQTYGLPVGVVAMDLTLHDMPLLLPGSQRSNAVFMNSVAIWGCAVGKLLFKGAKTDRKFGPDGLITQETHMRFAYRPVAAWDKILHPTDPTKGWVQVTYNNVSVLQSFDFNSLIPTPYFG